MQWKGHLPSGADWLGGPGVHFVLSLGLRVLVCEMRGLDEMVSEVPPRTDM